MSQLVSMLGDADWNIRTAVQDDLRKFGDKTFPLLLNIVQRSTDSDQRYRALELISEMDVTKRQEAIRIALQDTDDYVRKLAKKIQNDIAATQGNVLPELPAVKLGTDICIVSKKEILAGDISSIETGLEAAINVTKQTKEISLRLVIQIGGYDEDRRQLWQIPEVISWFAKLDPKVAYWLDDSTIPLYTKICALNLSESDVRSIFAWSPGTQNVLPPYNQGHKELAMIMLIYATGNRFCEKLFGGDKKTAERIIKSATHRIQRSLKTNWNKKLGLTG